MPNEGYTFINWTENDQVVSENATYEFEVLNDLLLTANFQTALSVSDESTSEFVIYPNPVSDLLYINHPNIQNFEISIFTLNGKLVVSNPSTNLTFRQSIYFLYRPGNTFSN